MCYQTEAKRRSSRMGINREIIIIIIIIIVIIIIINGKL